MSTLIPTSKGFALTVSMQVSSRHAGQKTGSPSARNLFNFNVRQSSRQAAHITWPLFSSDTLTAYVRQRVENTYRRRCSEGPPTRSRPNKYCTCIALSGLVLNARRWHISAETISRTLLTQCRDIYPSALGLPENSLVRQHVQTPVAVQAICSQVDDGAGHGCWLEGPVDGRIRGHKRGRATSRTQSGSATT